MLLAIEGSEVVVGFVRLFARIFPFFFITAFLGCLLGHGNITWSVGGPTK